MIRLTSGKEVRILGVGKLVLATGVPLPHVKYQTELSIDDLRALGREAQEVWTHFSNDADMSGFKDALVSANEIRTNVVGTVITANKGYNFVFKKQDDGAWVLLEKRPEPSK